MKNRHGMLKTLSLILCACLMLALLSACGSGEREKEAENLIKEGKFGEAFAIYAELKKTDKQEDIHKQAYEAAAKAFEAGDTDRAVEILSDFESYKDCLELLYEVRNANSKKSVVSDIQLDGNSLSFSLIKGEGDEDFRVRIMLYANNETLAGYAALEMKAEEFAGDGTIPVQIDLADAKYMASKKLGLFLVDAAATKNTTILGSKGIRQDGTEGVSVISTTSVQFTDPAKAFSGGTLSVAVYHEYDGDYLETKEYPGEQTVQIP